MDALVLKLLHNLVEHFIDSVKKDDGPHSAKP